MQIRLWQFCCNIATTVSGNIATILDFACKLDSGNIEAILLQYFYFAKGLSLFWYALLCVLSALQSS